MLAKRVLACENQFSFRPGQGCFGHIFILRQTLEHKQIFHDASTISVVLDLKQTINSVRHAVFCNCLSLKGVSEKVISVIQSV